MNDTPFASRPLLNLLLIALGFFCLVRILLIVRDFPAPTELTFPNSVMVYKAREVQQGRSLYTDFREPPHVLTVYGPLLYAVPGWIGRLVSADGVTLFRMGRVISLLGTAGALMVVGWIIRRSTRLPAAHMAVFVMLFFTAPILWPVCMVFRPDAMEMFWTLGGLALFARWQNTPWRYASLAAFVMAVLYKQTGIVGPAAATAYLIVNRRWREGLGYAAAAGVVIGAVVAMLNVATGGLHWLNSVTGLRGNVTWHNLVSVMLESAVARCVVPFVPAMIAAAIAWRRGILDLYSVAFVVTFLAASASTLRDGSADNYFLTPLALATVMMAQRWSSLCAFGGVENDHSETALPDRRRRAIAHGILVLALIVFAPRVWRDMSALGPLRQEIAQGTERHAQQLAFVQDAANRLDALGGPVLCQFDPVNLYLRNLVMMDTFTFGGMTDQGAFDDAAIIAAIRERRMSAVVLLFPAHTRPVPAYQSTSWVREEWLNALVEAGYQERPFGPLFIYTPR